MLRADDDIFIKFGQCYMTTTYPGVVKAWHFHKIQTDNFVAITGMFKVALYDDREDSPTHGEVNEFFLGDFNPTLLQIPPGVYHGWKCISEHEGIVVNVSTETLQLRRARTSTACPSTPTRSRMTGTSRWDERFLLMPIRVKQA